MSKRSITLLTSASVLAMTTSAWAQQAAQQQGAANSGVNIEEIVVTGSRIQQSGFSTPTPVAVLNAEELEAAAPQGVAMALNQLPQFLGSSSRTQTSANTLSNGRGNFLNLRDNGAGRTLILMDGLRVPPSTQDGSVDTDFVPEMLVARVDTVTAGASAVYGSDAVTGVVNFILDKKFTGIKGLVQGGIASRGDAETYRLGAAFGTAFAGGRGHALLSIEQKYGADLPRTARKIGSDVWGGGPRYVQGQRKPDGTIAGNAGSASNPIAFEKDARTANSARDGLIVGGPPALYSPTPTNAFQFQFSPTGRLIPFNNGAFLGPSVSVGGDAQSIPEYGSYTGQDTTDHAYGRVSYDLVGSSRVDLQACKLEYSIVSPK